MAKLLRYLDFAVKAHWDHIKAGEKERWIKDNDLPPRMLGGWTDDSPSTWLLDTDAVQGPTQSEILVAVCGQKKGGWEKIAYITFEDRAIADAGLRLEKSQGNTKVVRVDRSGRHFEIAGLTGRKVCDLILAILRCEYKIHVFKETECRDILYSLMDSMEQARAKSAAAPPSSTVVGTLSHVTSDTSPSGFRRQQAVENAVLGSSAPPAPARESSPPEGSGAG